MKESHLSNSPRNTTNFKSTATSAYFWMSKRSRKSFFLAPFWNYFSIASSCSQPSRRIVPLSSTASIPDTSPDLSSRATTFRFFGWSSNSELAHLPLAWHHLAPRSNCVSQLATSKGWNDGLWFSLFEKQLVGLHGKLATTKTNFLN